jgi:hypothetical protein
MRRIKKRGEPQRQVKAALFQRGIGYRTVHQLLAMSEDDWGSLRDRINDARIETPDMPLATCLHCGGGVYISTRKWREQRLPLFRHFNGAGLDCPWRHEANMSINDARALQYGGRQESELHRRLCEMLAQLLRKDHKCLKVEVGRYRPPSANEFGRYPDTYVELEGLPPLSLEIQLSNTFATEIAERGRHYGREGVGLIWVLFDVDPRKEELRQSFRDVVRRHRGNLFVLDNDAIEASEKKNTLILSCYVKKQDDTYSAPKRISLYDLTIKPPKMPYFQDVRTEFLLQRGSDARARWWIALKAGRKIGNEGNRWAAVEFAAAYASLRHHVPDIRQWRLDKGEAEGWWAAETREHLYRVIAILFSIASTAKRGIDANYIGGEQSLLAMLNARLNGAEFSPYASLIETMLSRTCASDRLDKPTLRIKLAAARLRSEDQVTDGHTVWKAASWIFPEVFDGNIRDELTGFGTLPIWAQPKHQS